MSIKLYTQKETTSDISCLGRNMFLFCFFAWKWPTVLEDFSARSPEEINQLSNSFPKPDMTSSKK